MNKSLNRRWSMVMVLMFGMVLLTACGTKYAALPINEDVDICAICKMQVKDDAYATQLTTKDGQNYKFDDIGCMNQWKTENGTDNIGMDYVRDYNDKEWIEYSKATYVYDASLRTPMAYGILNFKDKPSAEAFIAEQGVGTIMTAEDLASHDWKQNTENMDMMGEHGHGEEGDGNEMHQEGEMKEESGH
ncbi:MULTISPECIES: nitrous oxide reductase accessory protein NosL [Paenibacillus]|uniref:Copper chaperone NosL n=1 Tax=Paenibacillus xylanexedens TaxID=528191 RepID=A0ABS4RUT3_PAEXY|nr:MULTISPECIES: nitrous oxide reductase accessory protein NosL [Paenibacillus]MBP2246633.1 copper chaperone NosL [Paenibacillus xylanexedens]MBY0115298.1 nitrous oxide reductase accessory protein NosL [Paenibacillus xylanexedens]